MIDPLLLFFACELDASIFSSDPFSQRRSAPKALDAATVVIDRRSFWSSVTLTELLIGVLNATLSLPQYLMQAMFVGAVTVSMMMSGGGMAGR